MSFEDEDASVVVTLHYMLRAQTIRFPKLKIFQCEVSSEAPLKVVASALALENGDTWKQYLFFRQDYNQVVDSKDFQRLSRRD